MLPDLGHRVDWGLHFIGFSQFGKEVHRGTEDYVFEPYNDIGETLGFNFLAVSHSDDGGRFPTTQSSVQIRQTVILGVVADHVTEFLQNDVAHWANFRGDDRLRRVPRNLHDTQEETSLGPTLQIPIVGYAREFFIRFDERQRLGATDLTSPSKFFLGGGFAISTINHEGFLHLGVNPGEFSFGVPKCLSVAICLSSVGVGGMFRYGVLLPSLILDDLTADYSQAQLIFDVNGIVVGFPLAFTAALTGARGFFAEPRTEVEFSRASRDERDPKEVFQTKRPKRERFVAFRLRIGEFSFEFLNDYIGGKDKGPTFGIHVALETVSGGSVLRWLRIAEDES